MAGGAVVLQVDPWGPSDVSAEALQSLIDDGLLRSVSNPNRPEWIAPGGELEPRPHDGYIVSFVSFHEHGLGLPARRGHARGRTQSSRCSHRMASALALPMEQSTSACWGR